MKSLHGCGIQLSVFQEKSREEEGKKEKQA